MFDSEISMRPGTRLGRFKIMRSLGKGGMGAVYYAQDTLLNTNVALKILSPELAHSEGFERFRREALLARQVTHEGICRIFDLHEEQGTFFISMEYVDGATLLKVLQDTGTLPPDLAVVLIRRVCRAVAVAHKADIMHRDLKPANIIVRGQKRISILDFGLSTGSNVARITQAGTAMGTVHYMPPEVVQGDSACKQSDLYSTGVILYQCLTGRLPFDGVTYLDLQQAIIGGALRPPSKINLAISQQLEDVILTAMAVRIADRYPSMQALEQALGQLQQDGKLLSGVVAPAISPRLTEYFPSAGLPIEMEDLEEPLSMPVPTLSTAPQPQADSLSSDFATEAVSSHPGALSSDFATEAVASQPALLVDAATASAQVAAAPPARSRTGLIAAGSFALATVGVLFGLNLALGDRGGLLGALRDPASVVDAAVAEQDAAETLVVAGAPDASAPAALDANTAQEGPAADAAPAVDADHQPAAKDRRGKRHWARKPRPGRDPDETAPPLPGAELQGRKSAQKRVMELDGEIRRRSRAKGISSGDSQALASAMKAMRAATRRRDYAAAERHGQRALDAIAETRVDRAFAAAKLRKFNKLLGDREDDWAMNLAVKINTAMDNGDYPEACRLLSDGMSKLRK